LLNNNRKVYQREMQKFRNDMLKVLCIKNERYIQVRNASFAKIMAHLLSRDGENAQVYIREVVPHIRFTHTHAYIYTH